MLSSRVNGSRHGVEAVRIRGADHREEIVVAYGEGVSHGIVKRKACASVIADGEDSTIGIDREARGHKAIYCAVVPALMLWHPVVRDVVSACCVRLGSVEMERQHMQALPAGQPFGSALSLAGAERLGSSARSCARPLRFAFEPGPEPSDAPPAMCRR